MKIVEKNGVITLYAEGTNKITNKDRTFYTNYIYLGDPNSIKDYEEVERDIWKNFVKVKDPDVTELKNQVNDINGVMDFNNYTIDSMMLAIDEIFRLLAGFMSGENGMYDTEIPSLARRVDTVADINNVLVNFYVLMVKRNLKKIEEIPLKYRENVRLELEKN